MYPQNDIDHFFFVHSGVMGRVVVVYYASSANCLILFMVTGEESKFKLSNTLLASCSFFLLMRTYIVVGHQFCIPPSVTSQS